MKYYVIILKQGVKSQEFEVETLEELNDKIDSGQRFVLPIRGSQPIKITRENIEKILDVTETKREELNRILEHYIKAMADPKVNSNSESKKMTENKIKTLSEELKKID